METRNYMQNRIEIDKREREELITRLKKYKSISQEKLGDVIDNAREAASFLLGNHFENNRSNKDETNKPEELGGRHRLYPNVPYLVHRIDKIVNYLMHDNANPFVEADEKSNFDLPPDHPFMQLVGQQDVLETFNAESHNELAANIMTAYLDYFRERSDDDENMATVAENACAETIAAVIVGYDPKAKPRVFIDRVRMGDFFFDPDALGQDVRKGRWVTYIERGRRRHDVFEQYGVEDSGNLDKVAEANDDDARDSAMEQAQGPQRSFSDDGYGEQSNNDTAPTPNKIVDVWHWWIKDTTQIDVGGEPVYQYADGWRYVVVVGDKVVFNGDSLNPEGGPPLFTFTYRPVGDRITGVSAYSLVKDINKALDRLQQYAIEAAYKQQPKTLLDRTLISNAKQLQENTVGGFVDIELKAGGNLSNAYAYLPGGGAGQGIVEQTVALRNLGDEVLGTGQLSMEDASRTQLSGDAIDGLIADRDGPLARMRDRFYKFQRRVYRCLLLHAITYDDQPVTLRVQKPDGKLSFIQIPMNALSLDGTDFELSFDVRIDVMRNAPRNPVKRAAYTLQTVKALLGLVQVSPAVALGVLEAIDVPDKDALRKIIAAVPPPNQNGGGPDPVAIEQAKNDMAVRRRIAESQSDAYESVVKDIARLNPQQAVDIINQLPQLVWSHYKGAEMPGGAQPPAGPMPPIPPGAMPPEMAAMPPDGMLPPEGELPPEAMMPPAPGGLIE